MATKCGAGLWLKAGKIDGLRTRLVYARLAVRDHCFIPSTSLTEHVRHYYTP
jgi:hypothetical protein